VNLDGVYNVLGVLCKRCGPGRLPNAERRDIGAGYALASTATGATLFFALIAWATVLVGVRVDGEFFGSMALIGLPLVVPTSFVSAVLVWRTVPPNTPHFGAVAGLLATVGTYLLSLLVLLVFYATTVVVYGQYDQFGEAVRFLILIGFVALISTCWLTFPVGVASGVIHERITGDGDGD
jgi:hypothetical protein